MVTRTFLFADTLVGVRTNSEACAAWLHEALGEYEYSDEEAAPYYSVFIAESGGRIGKPFHVLYRETDTVVKTFDLSELGRVLLTELETHTLTQRDDAVYVRCSRVTRNGTTAVMPASLASYMATVGTRTVERHGLAISEPTALAVDASGAIGPLRRTLHVPIDALDRIAEIAPSAPAEQSAAVDPGSPDIVFVGNFWMDHSEVVRPVSRGYVLYRLATLTPNLDTLRGKALASLARLLQGARCYEIREGSAAEVVETLSAVLAGEQPA